MGLTITVDASAAIRMLQNGAANLPGAIARSFAKGGAQMQDIARGLVHVRTGELQASITYMASEAELIFTATAPYAHWVEFGRGPVRPIHAKALHWDDVFAKYAGPAPPQPFMRPAYEAAFPEMLEDLADAIGQGFE